MQSGIIEVVTVHPTAGSRRGPDWTGLREGRLATLPSKSAPLLSGFGAVRSQSPSCGSPPGLTVVCDYLPQNNCRERGRHRAFRPTRFDPRHPPFPARRDRGGGGDRNNTYSYAYVYMLSLAMLNALDPLDRIRASSRTPGSCLIDPLGPRRSIPPRGCGRMCTNAR